MSKIRIKIIVNYILNIFSLLTSQFRLMILSVIDSGSIITLNKVILQLFAFIDLTNILFISI
jgi:hypothetical protein